MKKLIFVLFATASLLGGSCIGGCENYGSQGGASDYGEISLVSWNLQALFDEKDDGWEYEEYRDGSGWSEEKFKGRLSNVARAIHSMGQGSPDIIAFIEVENRAILEKLATEYLGDEGYKHCFFAGNAGYSLGVGLLSKYPLKKSVAHSINISGEVIPRPIAEVTLEVNGKSIVLFICHWKSKLGGEAETEKLRREAASVILRRHREILSVAPNTPIVVLGDLNENYDEYYRTGGSLICALMPDDPEAARLAGYALKEKDDDVPNGDGDSAVSAAEEEDLAKAEDQDFLIISFEKPPISSFYQNCTGVFYSPWADELQNGTYFYDGAWETIDHILLNKNFFSSKENIDMPASGWQFDNCFVMDAEPFTNSRGEPDSYNPRTGSGLSDHLPLLLRMKVAK
jgi:endonuclease/exonuclease/phosphatase family metal-dependent hydrolase